METLQQASHKLAEAVYKDAQAQQTAADPGAGQAPPTSESNDEGAVDADYEVVNDDDKK